MRRKKPDLESLCQQCGAMTGEEAASKCLGAAAGDDCHGNHLWPT